MTCANANALFQTTTPINFSKSIAIKNSDPEAKMLRRARAEVRAILRSEFSSLRKGIAKSRELLLEDRSLDFSSLADRVRSLDLRFLTQGSYAYRTLIRPAQPRYQEIDLDDGIYISMPFVEGRPLFSSTGLFDIIERALQPLAEARNWVFKRKDTCIRLCMSTDNAHIDLPLFAIEEGEFQRLENQYFVDFNESSNALGDADKVFKSLARQYAFQDEKILLAHREDDWLASDPKKIHDWFEGNVGFYGESLRRVCRYMKAWRDETWQDCKLSSLALMVASVEAFKELGDRPSNMRDDLLALEVAKKLPEYIRSNRLEIPELKISFYKGWSEQQKQDYILQAENMFQELDGALNGTMHTRIVVNHLQTVFGDRMPYLPEEVRVSTGDQIDAILETKATKAPAPKVGTSVSG